MSYEILTYQTNITDIINLFVEVIEDYKHYNLQSILNEVYNIYNHIDTIKDLTPILCEIIHTFSQYKLSDWENIITYAYDKVYDIDNINLNIL